MANPNTLLVERAACPAEWVPLPNGRLGLPLEDASSKKRRVYLATDGKTRLCEHGETASAISQYAAGSRNRPSDSRCSCKNLDGLTAGRFAKPPPDWHPPSYFDVLVARDTKEVELQGGRFARKLPHTGTSVPVYMLPCGNLRCAHGNSEATLRAIAKHPDGRRRPCGCTLGGRSWRCGRLQTLKTLRAF